MPEIAQLLSDAIAEKPYMEHRKSEIELRISAMEERIVTLRLDWIIMERTCENPADDICGVFLR